MDPVPVNDGCNGGGGFSMKPPARPATNAAMLAAIEETQARCLEVLRNIQGKPEVKRFTYRVTPSPTTAPQPPTFSAAEKLETVKSQKILSALKFEEELVVVEDYFNDKLSFTCVR